MGNGRIVSGPVWTELPPDTYRIMAWLTSEPEGGFSVVGINLPGCVTQGETWDEALANLKEAATALIESHRKHGERVPFLEPDDERPVPPDLMSKRVTVFVHVLPEMPNP